MQSDVRFLNPPFIVRYAQELGVCQITRIAIRTRLHRERMGNTSEGVII